MESYDSYTPSVPNKVSARRSGKVGEFSKNSTLRDHPELTSALGVGRGLPLKQIVVVGEVTRVIRVVGYMDFIL